MLTLRLIIAVSWLISVICWVIVIYQVRKHRRDREWALGLAVEDPTRQRLYEKHLRR